VIVHQPFSLQPPRLHSGGCFFASARLFFDTAAGTDGKAEGKAEGRTEGKFEVALCMLKKHFDYQTIAEMTQLSVDAIENLAKKNRLI